MQSQITSIKPEEKNNSRLIENTKTINLLIVGKAI